MTKTENSALTSQLLAAEAEKRERERQEGLVHALTEAFREAEDEEVTGLVVDVTYENGEFSAEVTWANVPNMGTIWEDTEEDAKQWRAKPPADAARETAEIFEPEWIHGWFPARAEVLSELAEDRVPFGAMNDLIPSAYEDPNGKVLVLVEKRGRVVCCGWYSPEVLEELPADEVKGATTLLERVGVLASD